MKTISLIFFLIFFQHFAGGKTVLHPENKSVFHAAAISADQAGISWSSSLLEDDDDETDSELTRQNPVLLTAFAANNFNSANESSAKFIARNLKPQRFLLYKIRVLRL